MAQFLQRNWVYISFIALPAGFIFASLGSFFINRFARRRWPGVKQFARPEDLFSRSLKGLDDKYAYFAWSLPASYVLVGPCGILLFALRGDRGRVSVQGDRWREPFSIGRIFTVFAREGVGNPNRELDDQANKLRTLLAEAPDGEERFADMPMDGAVVFLNGDVELKVENPTVPVLRPAQVKDFIRRKAKEVKLNTSTLRSLSKYLADVAEYAEDA